MCCMLCSVICFFFKQKTAYEMRISDWSSDVCSSDLPDRMAEEIAHCPPRCVDWRLAVPFGAEPCAMYARDPAVEIGDGRDHRRPGLGRRMLVRPVVAAWMDAE